MAKTLEQLMKEIMAEAEADGEAVTEAEAKEMAEMELKAKGIKNYTQGEKPKPKTKREVKLDDTKVHLIKMLYTLLGGMGKTDGVVNVKIANPQKEITFNIGEDIYSISLIKHRPPKK